MKKQMTNAITLSQLVREATANGAIDTERGSYSIVAMDGNGRIYHIYEGTGDNLTAEDEGNGYVDYFNYDVYEDGESLKEGDCCDGGMFLLEKLYRDLNPFEILAKLQGLERFTAERAIVFA